MKVSNFQLFGTPGKSTGKYGIPFHFNKRQMSINENKSNYIICDKYQTLIAPSPQTLGTPTDTEGGRGSSDGHICMGHCWARQYYVSHFLCIHLKVILFTVNLFACSLKPCLTYLWNWSWKRSRCPCKVSAGRPETDNKEQRCYASR